MPQDRLVGSPGILVAGSTGYWLTRTRKEALVLRSFEYEYRVAEYEKSRFATHKIT